MSAAAPGEGGYGPQAFGREFAVSRETQERLARFADLLARWQATTNLVAPSTLPDLWQRHMADSAQLVRHAPEQARHWLDMGAGAGFPGLVVALMLAARPGLCVDLAESNARKCAFLREAVRITGAPARILCKRLEDIRAGPASGYDVIMARALAPLAKLMELSAHLRRPGTVCLFLKGQDVDIELTEASKYWRIRAEKRPSATSPSGTVLIIHEAVRV